MIDQHMGLIKEIDIAVEEACAIVDNAANNAINTLLDSLRKKYHNHHFRYTGEMGQRCLSVYRKDGTEAISFIDGDTFFELYHICYDKSRYLFQQYETIKKFMFEFECALNQQHYFDADTTDIPKAVEENHLKEHGKSLSKNFGVNVI